MSYTPHEGYFDLTNKPRSLTKREHKKIQDMQTDVIRQAEIFKSQKVREDNKRAFDELRDFAAKLQQIIVEHWGEELFKEDAP